MNLVVVPRRPVPPKIVVANCCQLLFHLPFVGFPVSFFSSQSLLQPTVDHEQSSAVIANQDIYTGCTF
jgi:hypothetical protein